MNIDGSKIVAEDKTIFPAKGPAKARIEIFTDTSSPTCNNCSHKFTDRRRQVLRFNTCLFRMKGLVARDAKHRDRFGALKAKQNR